MMNGKNTLKTVYSFCLIGAVLCFVCAVNSSSCSAQGYYPGYSSNGYNSGSPSGYYDEEDEPYADLEAAAQLLDFSPHQWLSLIIGMSVGTLIYHFYFVKKEE